mgnify:CR=1 FL=1
METIITILSIGPPSLIFANMVGFFFNQSLKFFILYILDVYKIRIGSNFIPKKLATIAIFF